MRLIPFTSTDATLRSGCPFSTVHSTVWDAVVTFRTTALGLDRGRRLSFRLRGSSLPAAIGLSVFQDLERPNHDANKVLQRTRCSKPAHRTVVATHACRGLSR